MRKYLVETIKEAIISQVKDFEAVDVQSESKGKGIEATEYQNDLYLFWQNYLLECGSTFKRRIIHLERKYVACAVVRYII